jgi:hypothetical protein
VLASTREHFSGGAEKLRQERRRAWIRASIPMGTPLVWLTLILFAVLAPILDPHLYDLLAIVWSSFDRDFAHMRRRTRAGPLSACMRGVFCEKPLDDFAVGTHCTIIFAIAL